MKFTSSQPSRAHHNNNLFLPARTKPNSIRQSFARQTFWNALFVKFRQTFPPSKFHAILQRKKTWCSYARLFHRPGYVSYISIAIYLTLTSRIIHKSIPLSPGILYTLGTSKPLKNVYRVGQWCMYCGRRGASAFLNFTRQVTLILGVIPYESFSKTN